MKHYFVDTNVVIDMLADREEYADAACELFDAAGRGEVHLSICALSYSTIYYILRKYAGKENAISSLRDLTDYVSILPVDAEVIRKALYSEFSDYEDAIQHYAALQDASVEGIITRKTLSKILCKWKQDSVISFFLYLDSAFKYKHKLVHNQSPV